MLTRSQLSLAHSAKVKTDMPERNEKQLEFVKSVWWVEGRRTMEEMICGKDEF